jgi:hypothetical protein
MLEHNEQNLKDATAAAGGGGGVGGGSWAEGDGGDDHSASGGAQLYPREALASARACIAHLGGELRAEATETYIDRALQGSGAASIAAADRAATAAAQDYVTDRQSASASASESVSTAAYWSAGASSAPPSQSSAATALAQSSRSPAPATGGAFYARTSTHTSSTFTRTGGELSDVSLDGRRQVSTTQPTSGGHGGIPGSYHLPLFEAPRMWMGDEAHDAVLATGSGGGTHTQSRWGLDCCYDYEHARGCSRSHVPDRGHHVQSLHQSRGPWCANTAASWRMCCCGGARSGARDGDALMKGSGGRSSASNTRRMFCCLGGLSLGSGRQPGGFQPISSGSGSGRSVFLRRVVFLAVGLVLVLGLQGGVVWAARTAAGRGIGSLYEAGEAED